MAISIDWATKVITVPKADTTLVSAGPPEIRSLDVNQFRKDLNALQAGEEGMWADTTHNHSPPVSVGGITLGRVVEIINGYTITFENGAYAVNLTGANNNVSDVVNLNSVSIRSANSAGLIEGSISEQVVEGSTTVQEAMRLILSAMAGKLSGAGGTTVTIRDIDDTKDRIVATVDANGNRTAITLDAS
jgi:hypothetical protein